MDDQERDRRFWAYIDMYEDGYRPLMDALTKHFGTEFAMAHTGGGCMAVEAILEGYGLMITDAADILSPWDERDATTGFGVGVYPLETYESAEGEEYTGFGSEAVGWASSPHANTTEQLVRLIRLAINSVGQGDPSFDHIDPKELDGGGA